VVLDGREGKTQLFEVNPFEAAFTGVVFVAAGDVNGDGVDHIVITLDEGVGTSCPACPGTASTSGVPTRQRAGTGVPR
jgi:hypothetical protein